MSWKTNAGMWWDLGDGWAKVTDHNRGPIDESIERIENSTRMANGTLRRYVVAKKRTWSVSWSNLPAHRIAGGLNTVDGGLSGSHMEWLYGRVDGDFKMMLRNGNALNKPLPTIPYWPYNTDEFYFARVVFSDFSRSIVKRGKLGDLWDVSVTLEEV